MQKSDLIRSKKWAMEDAFLREVGASLSGSTSMRSWDEPWEISKENRDRPGGHQTQYMSGWNGWQKSKYAKRKHNKKMRREHVRITAEAVRDFYEDHELYLQEMAALYDDFEDDYHYDFEDDYGHPHYFEDDYDPFWDDLLEAEQNMGLYDHDPFWDYDYLV